MALATFEFMPFGGEVVRDPYPVYDRMREAGDVLRTPFGAYLVHRYADVRRVHMDHASFSMSAGGMGAAIGGRARVRSPEGGMGGSEFMLAQTMLTTDPPDHERLRRVVQAAFTPGSIARLEDRVRAITRELLAPLRRGEPFDIVAGFAAQLPTIVIAELLGIPPEDGAKFRQWTDAITGTGSNTEGGGMVASMTGGGGRFGDELRAYLAEQIQRRKSEPTDDLIGRMVVANADEIMTDAEVVASCVLLLIAGNETTMRLITNMTLALGRHPDQLDRMIEDRSLVASAVEETLRYDSPVQLLFRGSKEAEVIGGEEIPKGSFVLTMLAAANRDPAAFEDPDTYDVGRADNMHVSFGHGIHFCIGAPLARRETRVAFEELLELAPRFEIVTPDDALEYPQMMLLRSPRSLVIRPT